MRRENEREKQMIQPEIDLNFPSFSSKSSSSLTELKHIHTKVMLHPRLELLNLTCRPKNREEEKIKIN